MTRKFPANQKPHELCNVRTCRYDLEVSFISNDRKFAYQMTEQQSFIQSS